MSGISGSVGIPVSTLFGEELRNLRDLEKKVSNCVTVNKWKSYLWKWQVEKNFFRKMFNTYFAGT
jgi:hypothetical protein